MKKSLLFLTIATIPFLTACGESNTLKCVREGDGASREMVIEFDSNKEKVTGVLVNYSIDFSDVEDFSEYGCDDLEDCLNEFAKEVEDCEEDEDFYECKIANKSKTGLTIQGKVEKNAFQKEFKDKNYKAIKELYEEEGYACK